MRSFSRSKAEHKSGSSQASTNLVLRLSFLILSRCSLVTSTTWQDSSPRPCSTSKRSQSSAALLLGIGLQWVKRHAALLEFVLQTVHLLVVDNNLPNSANIKNEFL